MKSQKTIRTLSVVATAALLVGGLVAGTADAKKKPKKCAPYAPSQWSSDIPVTMVTDAHTAEAPLEITVPTSPGAGTSSSDSPENSDESKAAHAFLNVQVDSAAKLTGLYGTLEFTPAFDYDLFFRGNDGVGLAYSAGTSHLVPLLGIDGTGHGGHSGAGTENIDGLQTADCTGYLVDVVTSIGPGGDVTLKLWLGDPAYVPGS